MSYVDLLRHPLWQKKRLEVFSEAGFKCSSCGGNDVELHVHHLIYRRGVKPWEYANHELQCLCKNCHRDAEHLRERVNEALLLASVEADCLGAILGMVNVVATVSTGGAIDECPCESYEEADGIGLVWGLTAEQVLSTMTPGDKYVSQFDLHKLAKSVGSLALLRYPIREYAEQLERLTEIVTRTRDAT